jgi:hypothetical protein
MIMFPRKFKSARLAFVLNIHITFGYAVSDKSCFQPCPGVALAKAQTKDIPTFVDSKLQFGSRTISSVERMHAGITRTSMLQNGKRSLNPALWPPPAKSTYGQRLLSMRPPLNGGGQKRTRRHSAATQDQPEAPGDNFAQAKLPVLNPDATKYQVHHTKSSAARRDS